MQRKEIISLIYAKKEIVSLIYAQKGNRFINLCTERKSFP